jgi:hypothetical protein
MMPITISDYADVRLRSVELGLNIPAGIALLPRNFVEAASQQDLIHEDHTSTVRSLWRQANVPETRLEDDNNRLPQITEKGLSEWVAPTIYVAASMMSQNEALVNLALNVVGNYISEILQALPTRQVRLTVVEEIDKGKGDFAYKKVEYVGNTDGLKDIPDVLKEVFTDGQRDHHSEQRGPDFV